MKISFGWFVQRTAILFLGMTAVLAVPKSMPAQDKAPAEVTITGCLTKGDAAGQYVIADEATKKNVTVMGDATLLDRHANNHKLSFIPETPDCGGHCIRVCNRS